MYNRGVKISITRVIKFQGPCMQWVHFHINCLKISEETRTFSKKMRYLCPHRGGSRGAQGHVPFYQDLDVTPQKVLDKFSKKT